MRMMKMRSRLLAMVLGAWSAILPANGGEPDFTGCFPPEVKTVGIVMPASIMGKSAFDRGVAALEKAGFRVKLAPRLAFDQVAPVADRARDFEEMWLDPEVDLVFCARGGKGAENVIAAVDWEKLRARPDRKVLGFSNITMILNAMLKKNIGHPFSGPTLSQFLYAKDDTFAWLRRALAGETQPAVKLTPLRAGAFHGLPCGGHISLVKSGIELGWNADSAGRVVFLERNASVDLAGVRAELSSLVVTDYIRNCAGVIFGTIQVKGAAAAEIAALKKDFADKAPCPVYDGYAYGHIPVSHAIDFWREVSVAEDGTMVWKDSAEKTAAGAVTIRAIAHRGLYGQGIPQNSLDSFKAAWAGGAKWIETDFHQLKDGRLLCVHDRGELLKVSGEDRVIGELTAADVERIDIGKVARTAVPVRMPYVEDVLATVPRDAIAQCEIKLYGDKYADVFDAARRAAGLSEKNILVTSFSLDALKDFKKRYPRYQTGWLGCKLGKDSAGKYDLDGLIAQCKAAGCEVFCPGAAAVAGYFTAAEADRVRAAGLDFRLFGVNSPKHLRKAVELRATAFTTDKWKQSFQWAKEIPGLTLNP